MLAATLVGGGPLLASQAGASAVLVATLQPPDGGCRLRPRTRRTRRKRRGARRSARCCCRSNPCGCARGARPGARPAGRGRSDAAPRRSSDATLATRERRSPRVGRVDARPRRARPRRSPTAGDAARISLGRAAALSRLDRYVVAVGELGLVIENARALARGAMRAMRARRLGRRRRCGRDPRARHRGARAGRAARGRRSAGAPGGGAARRARSPTRCWRRPRTCRRAHRRPGAPVAVDLLRPAACRVRRPQERAAPVPSRRSSTSPRPSRKPGSPVSSAHVHLRLLELAGVVPVHRLPAGELVEHPDARLAAAVARLAVAAEGQVRLGAARWSCSPTPCPALTRSRNRNADFGSFV